MERELIDEFAANNFVLDDQEVAKQCASLCASFGLEPPELVTHWELFYLNSQLEGGKVLGAQIDNFRQFIQKEQRDSYRRQQSDFHIYSKDDVDMLLHGDDEDDGEKDLQTPVRRSKRAHSDSPKSGTTMMDADGMMTGPKTPGSISKPIHLSKHRHDSPATPFSQRSSRCTAQFVLNKHLPESYADDSHLQSDESNLIRRLRPIESTDLQIVNAGPKAGSRYMHDRIEDRFNALEARIKKYADAVGVHESSSINNHVAVASQEKTLVVGMICCDGEGHINDKSVLLQGSVEHSDGQRVRLDLNNVEQFSIFPGQILGVEGRNPSGHCLVVSRLVDSMPASDLSYDAEAPQAKRQSLDADIPLQKKSDHLSMVIAAGPFTTSDNLAFEPLTELLNFAKKKRPHLLLLMGPFVDSEHPQIKLGAVDRTFHQLFEEEVKLRIEEYCEDVGDGSRVVLVPSIRDAQHDFVFPQPPFDAFSSINPDHQITLLGNPGLFALNEVTIGCCTMDVLRHLSSEEAARVSANMTSDRLGRLAAHILGQRSFYPLYPAAIGVPLDLSLSIGSLNFASPPDILITPSDLAPFVKVLPSDGSLSKLPLSRKKSHGRSTLCINPGRLAKGVNGGTFSHIVAAPLASHEGRHCLEESARVSIIRI